jgi:AraC-like DNA-binding protein
VERGAIVSRAQLCSALAASARSLGDPCLGLHIGSLTDPAKLGASGAALVRGRTLAQGLRQHARMLPTIHSDVDLTIRVDGPTATWIHTMRRPAGDGLELLYEGASAFICKTMRALAGRNWRPLVVRFPHSCRGRLSAYEDFFQAPVQFGVGVGAEVAFAADSLGWDVALPSAPNPAADADPVEVEMPEHRVAAAVMAMIESRLGDESLSLAQVSQTLGMPLRSVQRRLAEGGWTFEAMLDQHRRQRAEALLLAGDATLTAIAMNLGYSDSAHFIRAFRRWTGRTPSAYVQHLTR